MCKKCRCGLCIVLFAAAAVAIWMLYERAMNSKEISHEGSTLVKDMRSVVSDAKTVASDAGKLSKAVVNETVNMKNEIKKEVKDVKDAMCGCNEG